MRVAHTTRCCAVGLAMLLVASGSPTQQGVQLPLTEQQVAAAEQSAGVRPLTMPTEGLPPAYQGMPFHSSVMAAGGVGPYTMTLSGDMPPGVTYEPGYNVITLNGVPTSTGSFNAEVTATDAYGARVTQTYTLDVRPVANITPSPALISDPEAMHISDADRVLPAAIIHLGEAVHISDAIMKDSVLIADPEAVHINDKTTVILGAQIPEPEAVHINDKITVLLGAEIPDTEAVHINDATTVTTQVGILPATAPAGIYNQAYSQTFTAAGNTGAVTVTPSSVNLPTGMSFGAVGSSITLSGTPTQFGTFTFSLTATDTVTSTTINYTLQVAGPTPQTITVGTPLPTPTFGGAPFSVSATSDSGLPVTITQLSGPVIGQGGGPYAIIGAGTAFFQATQTGNATYGVATPVNFSVTIAPATQNITIGTLPTPTFGGAPFSVSATSDSGLPVTITYISGPATGSGNGPYTATGGGTVNFQATQSGNGNYAEATPVNFSVNIGTTPQNITVGTLPTPTYGGAPFSLSATSDSGLPVTITYISGPVTGSGNGPYTITGGGTANFQATQAGNASYSMATPVNFSVNIAPAGQMITVGALPTPTFGASPFSLSATSDSGLPVTITYISGPVTGSGNGPYTITGAGTVNFQATQTGNSNFSAATPVNFSVNIAPAGQMITVGALPAPTFGGAPFSVSATSDSGLPVTITYVSGPATGSGNGPYAINGTGLVNFQATQSGNSNYSAAAPVNFSVYISKQGSVTSVSVYPVFATPVQSVQLTANVVAALTGTPTGTVTFYDNNVQIGTPVAVIGGLAQFSTLLLSGAQIITATYSGDTDFLTSSSITSAATIVNVAPLDFTLTPLTSLNLSVVPGTTGSFSFNVTPLYNIYPGPVSFTLTGLPAGATYTITPSSIAANGGPQTVTVTILTPAAVVRNTPPRRPGTAPLALAVLLPLLALSGLRHRRRWVGTLLVVVSIFAVGALSGCGSGTIGNGFFGQAPTTYPVVVTISSGTMQHSLNVTLQVQ